MLRTNLAIIRSCFHCISLIFHHLDPINTRFLSKCVCSVLSQLFKTQYLYPDVCLLLEVAKVCWWRSTLCHLESARTWAKPHLYTHQVTAKAACNECPFSVIVLNCASSSFPVFSSANNLHYFKGFESQMEPWRSFADLDAVFAQSAHKNSVASKGRKQLKCVKNE